MSASNNSPRVQQLAETALKKAEQHCRSLNVDPTPHKTVLTNLVIKEIKAALKDIAHDRIHGGPAIAFALTQPFFQEIYLNDGSRRAAESLAAKLLLMEKQTKNPPRQIH